MLVLIVIKSEVGRPKSEVKKTGNQSQKTEVKSEV